MEGEVTEELGMFEGFNFRSQSAIERLLTAEDVLNWDHDAEGEAEFWPDGSNPFVQKLLPGTACTAAELREVARIFEELENSPHDLVKAIYLRDQGESLEEIGRQSIDDSFLYVFGPGAFIDLEREAAYELFETFWPDTYKIWEGSSVPGLSFDTEDFIAQFPTLELRLPEGGYLIVGTR